MMIKMSKSSQECEHVGEIVIDQDDFSVLNNVQSNDQENNLQTQLVLVFDSGFASFDAFRFEKKTFELNQTLELQKLLWMWHELSHRITEFSHHDLLRLRNFIRSQLHNFDDYIASYSLRRLCLDYDLQSGEIGQKLFREHVINLERQAFTNPLNLFSNLSEFSQVQLRLLDLSFPVKVIIVRDYLKHITRLIDISLGLILTYDFPLLCRSVTS